MIATPSGAEETVLIGPGRSLVAALFWAARAAASILDPPSYEKADLDAKFIDATDSPRSRLQSKRRGQTRTTESHN